MMTSKVRKICLFLGVGVPLFVFGSIEQQVPTVTFEQSIRAGVRDYYLALQYKLNKKKHFRGFFALLKYLYEKNQLSKIEYTLTPRIPYITHQIWLGSSFPEKYEEWRATWIAKHPGWIHFLWTDHPPESHDIVITASEFEQIRHLALRDKYKGRVVVVDTTTLNLYNAGRFFTADNYGEQSDILRLEILYHLGGVYLDIDFECVRSFDLIHSAYDFYGAILPLDSGSMLANGLIGSIPGHPILRNCMVEFEISNTQGNIIERGPGFLGKCIYNYLLYRVEALLSGKEIRMMLFPPSYFFPITNATAARHKRNTPRTIIEKSLCPETFAIHHWAGSWIGATIKKSENSAENIYE